MTDELRGAFGRCDLVKKVPSRGVTQIVVEVPSEFHVAATALLDGRDVWVEIVPEEVARVGRYCVINGEPLAADSAESKLQQSPTAKEAKPYGKQASELYKSGFWFVPAVLAAIGTDQEYRAWIQRQPCVVCGGGDYVEELGENRCEAAHVKRPNNSGIGHKPDYSCVSLCHEDHAWTQHQQGLTTLYAKYLTLRKKTFPMTAVYDKEAQEWFDKMRDRQLIEWASTTVAREIFKVESTGFVEPRVFVEWADRHEVGKYLPEAYKNAR